MAVPIGAASSALRAADELNFHVLIARNNRLTEDEITEAIYYASRLAGLPAANTARKIAPRKAAAVSRPSAFQTRHQMLTTWKRHHP